MAQIGNMQSTPCFFVDNSPSAFTTRLRNVEVQERGQKERDTDVSKKPHPVQPLPKFRGQLGSFRNLTCAV